MSNSRDRIRASRRRLRDENAVKRQTGIAKIHGAPVEEPHKFAKHHAMNCGISNCVLCGNPRRTFRERTIQEQRMMQDVDRPTNGESDDGKN